ncbi:MAG: PAS domain-containing protein [Elusimicrobiota bacterium]|nr:PAS domain-containing protein [Elusimicrobiota bacterium]
MEAGAPASWLVPVCADCDALVDLVRATTCDAVLARLPPRSDEWLRSLSRLRAAAPGVPVVVVVPPEREEDGAAAVAAGAADYWVDGAGALRLQVTLERAVAARRAVAYGTARDEALDRVTDAVVVTDEAERITFWNAAAARLYGYPYAEALGRGLADTLAPHWLDPETRRKAWDAVARNGVWLGVTEHAGRDGGARRVEVELWRVRDGRGRPAGLLLVARPAEEGAPRAQPAPPAEPARSTPREFLERILNGVADPIFVKDRDHRFVFLNDACCALIGREREELLGKSDYDFFPKEQADVFWRQDELVFTSGRADANEETLTDAQGRVHILVTKKTTWTDREGRRLLVGIIRDITEQVTTADELKRSQLLLRHAQKMEAVGRLAGGVAHDFNNLLTAIVGGANLLLETLPPGHEGRVDAEEVRRAGERAAGLTRRLLSFARREPAAARPACLRELVEGMRPLLERLLPPHVQLETSLTDAPVSARLDPGEFEQVLLNLVLNAGDAMPGGGRVRVNLAAEGDRVRLSVTDTGEGMDAATAARVFDPFFTTKAGGTGLGLSTVRDIARGSGATVEVESAPGRGATFHVRWPLVEGRAGGDAAAPGGLRRAPRRASVLVAEDDDVVRRFVARCLERAGCDVVTAVDGLEALRLGEAHEGSFDVLVIDAVLPRLSGVELAARLRRSQPTARVVFMSGYRAEEALGAEREGVDFLMKPFSAADLSELVGALLSR